MATDPRDEVEAMLNRLTFEAVNSEIDRGFAGEIGKLLNVLREKLKAAEAERDTAKKYMAAYAECDRIGTEACRSLEAQLTEVRAGQAVAWLAGYRAGWNDSVDDSFLTEPPADLTAALAEHDLRVRDAALEEAAKAFEAWGDLYGRNSATYIRALKKGADT